MGSGCGLQRFRCSAEFLHADTPVCHHVDSVHFDLTWHKPLVLRAARGCFVSVKQGSRCAALAVAKFINKTIRPVIVSWRRRVRRRLPQVGAAVHERVLDHGFHRLQRETRLDSDHLGLKLVFRFHALSPCVGVARMLSGRRRVLVLLIESASWRTWLAEAHGPAPRCGRLVPCPGPGDVGASMVQRRPPTESMPGIPDAKGPRRCSGIGGGASSGDAAKALRQRAGELATAQIYDHLAIASGCGEFYWVDAVAQLGARAAADENREISAAHLKHGAGI